MYPKKFVTGAGIILVPVYLQEHNISQTGIVLYKKIKNNIEEIIAARFFKYGNNSWYFGSAIFANISFCWFLLISIARAEYLSVKYQ